MLLLCRTLHSVSNYGSSLGSHYLSNKHQATKVSSERSTKFKFMKEIGMFLRSRHANYHSNPAASLLVRSEEIHVKMKFMEALHEF